MGGQADARGLVSQDALGDGGEDSTLRKTSVVLPVSPPGGAHREYTPFNLHPLGVANTKTPAFVAVSSGEENEAKQQ